MPRKLVKDSYRGWYGWEARFNSMIRMSLESMNNTNAKNKRERFEFNRSQTQLLDDERKFAEKSRKDLFYLRQELFAIRAYGKAYEKYSFYNSDNAKALPKEGHKEHTSIFMTQMVDPDENQSRRGRDKNAKARSVRSDRSHATGEIISGSSPDVRAQRYDTEDTLETHSNSAANENEVFEDPEEKTIVASGSNGSETDVDVKGTSREKSDKLPKPGSHKTTRVTFADMASDSPDEEAQLKEVTGTEGEESETQEDVIPLQEISVDDKTGSSLKKQTENPPHYQDAADDENDDDEVPEVIFEPKILTLPSITSIFIKQKDDAADRKLNYQKAVRRKYLGKWSTAISAVRSQIKVESQASETSSNYAETARAELTDAKSLQKAVARGLEARGAKTKQEIRAKIFPAECRNTFTLKRFIETQAEEILKVWTPETVRRHKVQQILAKVRFPELVNRRHTTSAIYRDYRVYQRCRGIDGGPKGDTPKETINETSLRALREKYSALSLPSELENGYSENKLKSVHFETERYNAYLLRAVSKRKDTPSALPRLVKASQRPK